MPFGSLITTLSAELGPLDRALDEAIRKLERYNRNANRLAQINLRQARGGVGGIGRSSAADPFSAAGPGGGMFAGSLAGINRDILRIGEQAGRERIATERRLGREENAIRLTQKNFALKQLKERSDAAKKAAREEADAARKADALIRESARARFAFIASQARAQETAARRAERIRTGEAISDLRGRISGIGERPISVQAGDPQAVIKLARQFEEANSSAAKFGRTIDKIAKEDMRKLSETTDFFVKRLLFLGTAGALAGIVTLVKKGFELNAQWERYRLALSASLALTQDVVTAQDQIVTGATALQFIGTESEKLFKLVRKEANETILETNELIQVFTENVGNAARAGLSIEQFLPLASNIAQLAKAIGLPGGAAQASQEIRAILEGQNLRNATIAKQLGLTTQLIAQAKEEGRLAELLNEKFREAQPIIDKFATSATALFSSLISKGQDFIRLSFEKTFEKARVALQKLNTEFTDAKVEEIAEKFSDHIVRAVEALERFARSDTLDKLSQLFKLIAGSPAALALAFRALLPIAALVPGAAGTAVGATAGIGALAFGAVAVGQAATRLPEPQNILTERAQARFERSRAVQAAREQLREAQQAQIARIGVPSEFGSLFTVRNQGKEIDEVLVARRLLQRRLNEQTESEAEVAGQNELQRIVDRYNKDRELRFRAKTERKKDNDDRLKELAMVETAEAEARGDRIAIIRKEAEERIASAKKSFKNEDLFRRLEVAERAKAERQIFVERQNAIIRVQKLEAEAAGNRRKALDAEAREAMVAARAEILSPLELRLRDEEALRNRRRQFIEETRAQNEKLTDSYKRQNEIIADAADRQTRLQKDLLDLQRRTAREQRDLIRQRIEAERELTNAIREQIERREDIQLRRRDLRSRQSEAAQRKRIEETLQPRLAVRGAARAGLSPEDVNVQIAEATQEIAEAVINSRARTPRQLATEIGEAIKSRGLTLGAGQGSPLSLARQVFGERTAAGRRRLEDVQTGREREALGLRREGEAVGLAPGLTGLEENEIAAIRLRRAAGGGSEADAIRLGELERKRAAGTTGTELAEGDREIQRRRTALEEIDQRQKELTESYRLAATELRDNFVNALRDTAETLRKANIELQTLLQDAQRSGLPIPANVLSNVTGLLQRESVIGPQLEAQAARGAGLQAAGVVPGQVGGKFDLTVGFDQQAVSVLSGDVTKKLIELVAPMLGNFIIQEARKAPVGGR